MRDIAEDSKQGSSPEKKDDSKKRIIIILILAAVIIIALIVVVIVLLNKNSKTGSGETVPVENTLQEKREVLATESNVQELVEQIQQEQEDLLPMGQYEAQMTFEWHFPTGDATSYDARVRNAPTNTNPVYFDLLMAEDEEHVIYRSPVIPLGAELNNFALDEDLDEGTYDCVLVYHLVDDDQNTISTVRFTVKVIIEV